MTPCSLLHWCAAIGFYKSALDALRFVSKCRTSTLFVVVDIAMAICFITFEMQWAMTARGPKNCFGD
jgi:hypothetical protein